MSNHITSRTIATAPLQPAGTAADPEARPSEEVRITGLPPKVKVRIRYATATGWRSRTATSGEAGAVKLSAPAGHVVTLSWPERAATTTLEIGPVGPEATARRRTGSAAVARVPLGRQPGSAKTRAVVQADLGPAVPAPPTAAPTPRPVEPAPAALAPHPAFRTPPADVDAAGRIVQPSLAPGLRPQDAVMVVSDSLADDAFHHAGLKLEGRTWAGQLEAGLQQSGGRRYVMSVARHGETVLAGRHNGYPRAGLMARLQAALKANPKPGTVVLALGTNDFRAGTPAAQVGQVLRQAIDHLASKAPGTRIVLVGNRYPSDYGRGTPAARAQRNREYSAMFANVHAHLQAVHRRTGTPVGFVEDQFAGLRDAQGRIAVAYRHKNDAVHPNAKGHARVLRDLMPALGLENAARPAVG